jgi:DNA polymerase/3'-5' exonuclease PolX
MMQLADATRIADGLVKLLEPATERIAIAGSIRRNKPSVKDIEILYEPRFRSDREGQGSMLDEAEGTVYTNLMLELLERWMVEGVARQRLGKDGKGAFGSKHQRMSIDGLGIEGVPVDLFAVLPGTPSQWGLQMMIRTGSGVGPEGDPRNGFGPAVLARWKAIQGIGPARPGSVDGCLVDRDGQRVETPTEAAVFEACRMDYVPPERRTHAGVVGEFAL